MNYLMSNIRVFDDAAFRKIIQQMISVVLVLTVLGMSFRYLQIYQPSQSELTAKSRTLGYDTNLSAGESDMTLPDGNAVRESENNDLKHFLDDGTGDAKQILPAVSTVNHATVNHDIKENETITDISPAIPSVPDIDHGLNADISSDVNSEVSTDVPVIPAVDSAEEITHGEKTGEVPIEEMPIEEVPAEETPAEEVPEETVSEPVTFMTESGFEYDENGMIISCSGVLTFDGVLVLPFDATCKGITASALSEISDDIFEIFIPANITEIEPGAFDCFPNLWYVEVQSGNPVYMSLEGELYYLDGTKF